MADVALSQAWKKYLFPCKLCQISLKQGRFPSSVGGFPLCISLLFPSQITKFPCKELPVLPVFSRPVWQTLLDVTTWFRPDLSWCIKACSPSRHSCRCHCDIKWHWHWHWHMTILSGTISLGNTSTRKGYVQKAVACTKRSFNTPSFRGFLNSLMLFIAWKNLFCRGRCGARDS